VCHESLPFRHRDTDPYSCVRNLVRNIGFRRYARRQSTLPLGNRSSRQSHGRKRGAHCPKVANPVAADETNLIAGAHLYRDHCALCHGDPANPNSTLADTLNPPPPQFMNDMPDMPENHNFYILQHGIRWTAMPAWKNVFSEQQTWQLVTFLSHMNNLPPSVKQVFLETPPQAHR
jgi:mono/diheme cytochrome c family protein